MDIKPIRPFKKTLPIPQQPGTPRPGVSGKGNRAPTEDGESLKVPEELLETGHKTPLLSAETPRLKRPGGKKRLVLIILGAILLVIISLIVAAFVWYNDALQPRSKETQRIRVVVETGATPEQVANELESQKVIKSSLAFQILIRQTGSSLQAGTYLLSPDQSSHKILEWLEGGKIDAFNVTIVPGITLPKIKAALIADGFVAADIDAAFAKTYDHPLLADKPADVNLDGYIYPETYQISSDTTVEQLLMKSFDEFYKQIQAKDIEAKLAARGFNLHQGITLASIVQRETANATDQRQVAQVFEKRFADGIMLGSDVTFVYAAELLGKPELVSIDSPYNTRKYSGLPPGAIANFNMSALTAVADPASGDYLFFVAGDDGVTHFSRTEAEHQADIKQYCTKLCNE